MKAILVDLTINEVELLLVQEEAGAEVPKVPRALNTITDVVLNYDPHKKRRRR